MYFNFSVLTCNLLMTREGCIHLILIRSLQPPVGGIGPPPSLKVLYAAVCVCVCVVKPTCSLTQVCPGGLITAGPSVCFCASELWHLHRNAEDKCGLPPSSSSPHWRNWRRAQWMTRTGGLRWSARQWVCAAQCATAAGGRQTGSYRGSKSAWMPQSSPWAPAAGHTSGESEGGWGVCTSSSRRPAWTAKAPWRCSAGRNGNWSKRRPCQRRVEQEAPDHIAALRL